MTTLRRKQSIVPLVFEELEPRILYSADTAALLHPDTFAPEAEVRSVDAYAAANDVAVTNSQVTRRVELVFIDPRVADADELVASIERNSDAGSVMEVVWLDGARDGIEQISDALEGRTGITALHLLAHGTPGLISLGGGAIDAGSVTHNATEIAAWAEALTDDADILIYGCDVASDARGQALVEALARLTGADVAASTNATGATRLGGDWNLEYTAGTIDTPIAIGADMQQRWLHVMANETVLDSFSVVSYSNNDGTQSWSSSWFENDNGGFDATGGHIRVAGGVLEYEARSTGEWIYRNANLTGALSATLSYTFDNTTFGGGTTVNIEVSSDGGSNYTTLKSYDAWTLTSGTESFNVSAYISATTRVRFVTTAGNNNDFLYIDDFQIAYVTGAAPVLDNTKSPTLVSQNEDSGAPAGAVGTLVSNLVDFAVPAGQVDNVTDTDAGALLGIAVTGANTTNGSWHYSTNNGTNWNGLGAVANNSTRLLAADANTRLYFQPNANYNGALADAITFRAWDRTAGTNGTLADTSTNGGTTAFSVATDTASLTVNAVNDAPVVTSATLTLNEGQAVTLSAANFGVTDPDNASFTYTVSGVSGGYFQLLSAPGTPITTFTSANLSGGLVQFVDDGNEVAPAFSVKVNDGAVDSNTLAATITYSGVNDAPVVTSAVLTVNEGQTVTLSGANFAITDPDNASFTYTVSGVSGGYFQLSGAPGTPITTFTSGNLSGGLVQFVDDGDEVAPAFSVKVNDGTVDSNTLAATVTYTALNDAPVVTSASLIVTRGATVTLTEVDIVVADPDHAAFTFTVSGVTGGFFQLSSAPATPITTFTTAQLAGGLVEFVDDGDAVAPAFSVRANDGTVNSNTLAASITFYLANAAPVLDNTKTPALTAQNEDAGAPTGAVGSLVSTLVDFAAPAGQVDNVTDADAGALLGIAVTAADTTNGTWHYSTNNGTNWNALGAVANNNARLLAADGATRLYFQANAGYHGTIANATTFHAWDRSTGANGGTANLTSASYTVRDNFGTAAYGTNDGTANWSTNWAESQDDLNPAAGQIRITGGELRLNNDDGGMLESIKRGVDLSAATSATLSFDYRTNANVNVGDSLSVQISSDGGASWTTLETFTGINGATSGSRSYDVSVYAAAGTQIRFAINAGFNGGSDFFYVDNVAVAYATGGTGGITPFSATADTAGLVVNPLADTPSVTNATTNEDTQSTSGLVISRNAADGAEVTHFKVTGITSGTLYKNDGVTQIANGSFITFAEGNAGLKFMPAADVSGSGSFTVQASLSNVDTGLGGGTATATITVNPVNDTPVLTSAALTVNEGQTVTLSGANFGVTDPDNAAFTYTASGITGGYFQLSSAPGTPITTFTSAQLAAGIVQFVDDGDEVAAGFSMKVNDGTVDSNTLAAAITYNPLNDAPVVTSATLTIDEAQTVTLAGANFGVTDPDNAAFTYTVSGVAGGYFQLSSAPAAPITTFTSAQLAGGLVQFVDDGNEVAPAFSVTANDGAASSNTLAATITYNPVNDTPVLTSAALTVNEGQTVTLGGANFGVTDPDDAAFTYTVSAVAGGYFQLSSAPGAPITTFTSANLAGGLVQFVDDGDEVAPSFSVKVNDGTVDSNTLTATITYDPVNDAPVVTSATLTLNEGQTVTLTAASFGITDPDNAAFTYTVSGVTGGYFQLTTSAGTPITTFTSADLAANRVQFVDDGDEVAPAFSVKVNDGTVDSNTFAATITYSPVNDAPVVTSATLAPNEGQTVTLGAANFGITDPDNAAFTYTVSGVTGGYFQLTTAAGTPVTTFTSADLAANRVQFVDDGNEVAPSFSVTGNDGAANSNTLAATITYTPVNDAPTVTAATVTVTEGQTTTFAAASFGITDPDSAAFTYTVSAVTGGYFQLSSAPGTPITTFTSANLAGGLVQFVDDGDEVAPGFSVKVNDGTVDSNTLAATITYSPVNDAPVVTSATLTVNEGQTVTVSGANFGVTDPDNAAFTYTVSGVTGGYFQLSSAPGTPVTTFSSAQLAGGLVQFIHDGNEAAPAFSVTTSDGAANSNTLAATITYNGVNDAPVLTSATLTVNEGQTATFAAASFGITDPDNAAFTYTVSAVTGGYFQLATAPGTPVTSFTSADLAANRVQFVDDGDEVAPAFSVRVNDGAVDSNTLAATITFSAVNDAPVMTSAAVTLNEGQTVTLTGANFVITDPDNAAFTYTVTGITGGYFQISTASGTPVTTFTSADLAAGRVQFVDDGDEVAPAFSVTVNDGAANSNTLAATIDYSAVNDAPVVSAAAITVTEGQTTTLSAANFGLTDPDSAVFGYTVSGVTGGYFQLTTAPATPITAFTSADLAANRVQFVDDGNEVTPAFSVTVSDGAANSNTLAATITFSAVNDAPVMTSVAVTLNEGQTVTLTGANFVITDPDNAAFTYTVNGITGGYFQISTASGTPVTTFTSADLAANRVQFVDDGNEVAPAFSVTINDGSANSNTLAATVTFSSVNDAPALTSATLTVNEGQTVTLAAANFGITDPDSAAFTYTVSGVTGGYFQLTTAPGTPITTFTSADLSASRVQFVDDGNEVAPAFSVRVNDGTISSNTLAATISYTPVNDAPFVKHDGAGLTFDGVNDYVAVTSAPSLVMSSTLTIEAWIRPQVALTSNMMIVNKEGEYEVALLPTGELQWAFANTNPGWAWHTTGYIVPFDQWSHVAVSYSSGVVNAYVNGTLVDTHNGTGNIGDVIPAFNELRIGTRSTSSQPQHFHGQIDDVRVWNTARTSNQIAFNASRDLAGTETGLVGLWKFDETAGTVALDTSIQANHGTLGGGTVAAMPARVSAYTIAEDTPLTIAAANGVLANDTDAENTPLTAVLVAAPANGALILNNDGSFVYTPAANFNGTDSFSYKASDGALESTATTVSITVGAVSDAPAGADSSFSIAASTTRTFTAADFGFSDPSDAPSAAGGHALSAVQIVSVPTDGSLVLSGAPVGAGQFISAADIAAGNLVYAAPGPAATITTIFTFRVQDTGGTANGGFDLDGAARTLSIQVNAAPAASPVFVGAIAPPAAPSTNDSDTGSTAGGEAGGSVSGQTAPRDSKSSITAILGAARAATDGAETIDPATPAVSGSVIAGPWSARNIAIAFDSLRKPPVSISAAASDILEILEADAQQAASAPLDFLGIPAGARFQTTATPLAGGSEEGTEDSPLVTVESGVKFSGAALSAGLVVWALRGAGLLTSLLASVPAWRHLDPVPVLAPEEEKPDWADNNDDESTREEHAVSNLFRGNETASRDGR